MLSSSSSISSSSSSGCCNVFYCNDLCLEFSSWTINGVNDGNSDHCILYVRFDYLAGNYQQIELYKDNLYSELVGIGQNNIAGVISLVERGGSGLSGTVTWTGTPVSESLTYLTCSPPSSSSSNSSSFSESSSTSSTSYIKEWSTSSASSSSSSSGCCSVMFCQGADCGHFSDWNFNGLNKRNSDHCSLYVVFEHIPPDKEEIRIYKSSSYSALDLVAIGQDVGVTIHLDPRNSSGLSGHVNWDQIAVDYPSFAILDCAFSSSSSSSISSSSVSSVSSSSSTFSSSSSSSMRHSSSSSSSSKSSSSNTSSSLSTSSSSSLSSSSSSINSRSSSSSSSQSLEGWNKTKPLILGMSAINGVGVLNRLAQTISVEGDYYSIGKVFCYFYGPFGLSTNFTLHLEVYTCHDNGKPKDLLGSSVLLGTDIKGDGWYSFAIAIDGVTPSNKYLCFVLWQENGDEDNYALWGYYYPDNTIGTKAWISNDAITWEEQTGINRSLKVISNFNAYDLTNFRIVTPSAERTSVVQSLGSGTYQGTKLVKGDTYNVDQVVIDYPDILASFVVDASGSMGWNDRYSNRQEFIRSTINRFKQFYPGKTLFDIVKFGALVANNQSINSLLGTATTIKLDLTTPTRCSYIFTVQAANATEGDVYESDSKEFTIVRTIVNDVTLIGIGDGVPLGSGILTKVSGSGDSTITYTTFRAVSVLTDKFVAYGFKNMEPAHPYNISTLTIDENIIFDSSINNWQPLTPGETIPLSMGTNGPKDTSSLDFIAPDVDTSFVLRRPIVAASTTPLPTVKISADLSIGATVVEVNDITVFENGDVVDLVDEQSASFSHTVSNVSSASSTFEISPSLVTNISSWNNKGGIVQLSNTDNSAILAGITADLLVRDIKSTEQTNITFFLQNLGGLFIEWDFIPFKEWYIYNLYWMDETASLPVSVFDKNGNPFPDQTKVYFSVDAKPDYRKEQIATQKITQDSYIGSDTIYVASTEGYKVGDLIDLLNNKGDIQTGAEITGVGTDTVGNYIKINPVLQFNFRVVDDAQIVKSITAQDSSNASSQISAANLLPSTISMVDITPIIVGKNLDPSLLKPYDPTPVSPSTTYDELNFDRERIRNNITDIPTIDGKASIRILPITEDNLKTVSEKEKDASVFIRSESFDSYASQLEQTEGDMDNVQSDNENSLLSLTTTTTTLTGADYVIKSPVDLYGGYAESSMITRATTGFILKNFEGMRFAGIDLSEGDSLMVKPYEILPSIVVRSDLNNTVIAKQYFTPFQIYFTPSYNIFGKNDCDDIPYLVEQPYSEDCPEPIHYSNKYLKGIYATPQGQIGEGFKIEYTILYKGDLALSTTNTGTKVKIRMYSNTVCDIYKIAQDETSQSRQDLNIIYPSTTQTINGVATTVQNLSDIDQWRQDVEDNSAAQLLEDDSEYNSKTFDSAEGGYADIIAVKEAIAEAGATESTIPTYEFAYWTKPWQWTKATQYGTIQETEIPIVDGKAVLEIPQSDVACLLLVQASVYFGDSNQYEVVRSDAIVVANPLAIDVISPFQIFAAGENKTYSIGTKITWKGQPIWDNVQVSFSPAESSCLPSVSKTSYGFAGGIKIGPHETVTMSGENIETSCPSYGEYEDIDVTAVWDRYTLTLKRKVEWIGSEPEELGKDTEFYFYVPDCGSGWADGSIMQTQTSSLADDLNLLWIGLTGIECLKGKNQSPTLDYPDGAPRKVVITNYADRGFAITSPDNRWVGTDGVFNFAITSINKNIGYPIPSTQEEGESPPALNNLLFRTSYFFYDSNGTKRSAYGRGVKKYPYYTLDESGQPKLIIPYPQIQFEEPLSVVFTVESYNSEFVRNGVDSPNLVAEVLWKGKTITNKFNGAEYPFPKVVFTAGTCKELNALQVSSTISRPKDPRNSQSGCLFTEEHSDVSLTSYASTASLSRTDIFSSLDGSHTHACEVDSDGHGVTIDTIILSGVSVEPHIHNISNYNAESSGLDAHTHELRCVAITQLNPLTNPIIDIVINAYGYYDPTNATPYSGTYNGDLHPENGNRMMFTTLSIPSMLKEKQLILTFNFSSGYTAMDITNTERGLTITASAKFSEYSLEDYPGHWTIMPSVPVPDGTRMMFEIDCFRPLSGLTSQSEGSELVLTSTSIREYMIIRLKASINLDGYSGSHEGIIVINSNNQWIPGVSGLLPEPTTDDIYITKAISQIDMIGASQIHDAVKKAAEQLITYQSNFPAWKLSKKVIFLLTDADENSSEYSIYQAINSVNFINGKCESPMVPLRLGYSYSSDNVLLNKYVIDTCGHNYYLINAQTSDIVDILNDFIIDSALGINDGIYMDTIDLGSDNVGMDVSLQSVLLPANSRITFRVRFSSDRTNWSSWSEWYDSSRTKDFEMTLQFKGRYFQYEIHLYGNENFESPALQSGLTLNYYKAQLFTTFFQPVDLDIDTDEYLASIHITHKAKVPATSTVNYGYSQISTTNVSDYYSVYQPQIPSDSHAIILSRYNELFLTEDYRRYVALNGGWPIDAIAEVYKASETNINGTLIDPSEYAINHNDGSITFYNIQNKTDSFVLCLGLDPAFRIICNVVNYGRDVAIIDHIGVLYNIAKRIPKDNLGNIIHTPVSQRI